MIPSRRVPCSRRSVVLSGRHLSDASRFPTVDDEAGVGACELSREILVRLLDDAEADVDLLNATLPMGFFFSERTMREDCSRASATGKKIFAALGAYQADCFRILAGAGGTNCSLKLSLGGAWDSLLDTPFDWTGEGLQACSDKGIGYGDYTVKSSFKCAFCSSVSQPAACASPLLVRLSVCSSEAWWPDAISAVENTLSLCQSHDSCSSLCYGYSGWKQRKRDVSQASKTFLPTTVQAQGREKPPFHETVETFTTFVLPVGDVVDVCAKDANCYDKFVVPGIGINVSTNVCFPLSNECKGFAGNMTALADAVNVLLPPDYRNPKAHLDYLDAVCRLSNFDKHKDCFAELLSYDALCAQPAYWTLCNRQEAAKGFLRSPTVQEVRAFEHCSEPGLSKFFGVVKSVNSACQGALPFNLSDRGGYRLGVNGSAKVHVPWESECMLPFYIGTGFIAMSFVIVAVFVVFGVAVGLREKHIPHWSTAADFTTDICRSRLFTVSTFTWVLFSFYILMTDYFVSPESAFFVHAVEDLSVPRSVYFLGLSVLWMPNFVLVLLANNPYRGRSSIPISFIGLLIQHIVAVVLIVLQVLKISKAPEISRDGTAGSGYEEVLIRTAELDIALAIGLVLFMDVSFGRMIFKWVNNRPSFFEKFNDRSLEYTAAKLDGQFQEWRERSSGGGRKHTNPSVARHVVIHIEVETGWPSHDAISSQIALKIFGGAVSPRAFVVTSVKRLLPGSQVGSDSNDAGHCAFHPDFISSPTANDESHLCLRDLEYPLLKTHQFQIHPSRMVAEVKLMVCGSCLTLHQRRCLCEALEDAMTTAMQQDDHDSAAHIEKILQEERHLLPSIDQSLIELMEEHLNSTAMMCLVNSFKQSCRAEDASIEGITPYGVSRAPGGLQTTSQSSTPPPLTSAREKATSKSVDHLHILLGPISSALRETVLAEGLAVKRRQEVRQELMTCGVLPQHADMLSCKPEEEAKQFQERIERAQRDPDGETAVQAMVAASISDMLVYARERLLQQLSDPDFRMWIDKNLDAVKAAENDIGAHSSGSAAAHYPLSAVFAFYDANAGMNMGLLGSSGLDFDPAELVRQLIFASHSQLAARAIKVTNLMTVTKAGSEYLRGEKESPTPTRRTALHRLRARVLVAMTLTSNPELIPDRVLHRKHDLPGKSTGPLGGPDHGTFILVSVMQDGTCRPQSTNFVLVRPELLDAMKKQRKNRHEALYVPTIIFISVSLAAVVIIRSVFVNLFSTWITSEWIMSFVLWLRESTDRVEALSMVAKGVIQSATPRLLQALMMADSGTCGDFGVLKDFFPAAGEVENKLMVAVEELQMAEASGASLNITNQISRLVSLQEDIKRLQTAASKSAQLVECISPIFSSLQETFRGIDWTLFRQQVAGDFKTDWEQLFHEADTDGTSDLSNAELEQFAQQNAYRSINIAELDTITKTNTVDIMEWNAFQANGGAAKLKSRTSSYNGQASSDLEAKRSDCKVYLRQYNCTEHFVSFLPRNTVDREILRQEFAGIALRQPITPVEAVTSLPTACDLYLRHGCEAPTRQRQLLLINAEHGVEQWKSLIEEQGKSWSYWMQGARDFASDLETFTGQSLLASVMLGSMTGLSICLLLMRRLVYRFRSAVMNVRRGHPDGHRFLDMIKQRRMSFVTIPKLVGLALFSWLYTFIIVSTIVTSLISFLSLPWLWRVVSFSWQMLSKELLAVVLELGIAVLVVTVALDFFVGKRMLMGGTEDLRHPVLWSWFAVMMLVFNILKGAVLAALRIVYMLGLNLIQAGILDKTVFPEGSEGWDPAYAPFASMVHFNCKYRHPMVNALLVRFHQDKRGLKSNHEKGQLGNIVESRTTGAD